MKQITTLVISFLTLIQLAGCQVTSISSESEWISNESSITPSDITDPLPPLM